PFTFSVREFPSTHAYGVSLLRLQSATDVAEFLPSLLIEIRCSCAALFSSLPNAAKLLEELHDSSRCTYRTLMDWSVEVIFGLPGDGINGVMEALRIRKDK